MAKDSNSADRPRRLDRVQREHRWNQGVLYGTIGVVAIVLGILVVGLLLTNFVWPGQPIAIVGDTEISTSDYQKRVRYERQQLVNQYNQNAQFYQLLQGGGQTDQFLNVMQQIEFQLQPEIVSQTVIQRMADEIIIAKEAEERGITVSDEEVEELLRSSFGFFPDGTPTQVATPTIIATSTLSAQQLDLVTPIPSVTPFITPTDLDTEASSEDGEATPEAAEDQTDATTVPATEESENSEEPAAEEEATATPFLEPSATATVYSLDAFEENRDEVFAIYQDDLGFGETELRQLLRNQLLRDKLSEVITVETEAVEEQVWARHILVQDEQTAKEVLQLLDEGETWRQLALDYSQDESNKNEAGNLGWFGFETMVEPFAEAAFALEIGEVSEPTESAFGWHIIQVLGKEDRQLSDSELDARRSAEFSRWLVEQREDIGVEIMDFLDARTPDDPGIIPISSFQQPQVPGAQPIIP